MWKYTAKNPTDVHYYWIVYTSEGSAVTQRFYRWAVENAVRAFNPVEGRFALCGSRKWCGGICADLVDTHHPKLLPITLAHLPWFQLCLPGIELGTQLPQGDDFRALGEGDASFSSQVLCHSGWLIITFEEHTSIITNASLLAISQMLAISLLNSSRPWVLRSFFWFCLVPMNISGSPDTADGMRGVSVVMGAVLRDLESPVKHGIQVPSHSNAFALLLVSSSIRWGNPLCTKGS